MLSIKDSIRRWRISFLHLKAQLVGELHGGSRVLILAPHPDDETFGCGGLIQRLSSQGKPPHVVILTGGGKSHSECCGIPEADLKQARRNLAQRALAQLGLPRAHLHLLDFPDGSISSGHSEMATLKHLVNTIAPRQVFIPHHDEGWPDHVVVRSMLDQLPLADDVEVYEYCVWLWFYNIWKLEWAQAFSFPMSASEWKAKCTAVRQYVEELAPCGKPWSGVLPGLLLRACSWHKEIYFKIK